MSDGIDIESVPSTAPWLEDIAWNEAGLAPAIAQDDQSGDILMLAWMNRQALVATAAIGEAVYWSRSRKKLWHKGESSGHVQYVSEIRIDCDADAIVLRVRQKGGIACHTGRRHCFYRRLRGQDWEIVDPVVKDPREIYQDKT
ncbi:phosphoribosyl-AMP cyclohydrolase [Chromatiales bacterium (ex Bugula neritina AB1)]|nr:phosphoribosyl-AMP cyclohydrolase [Chromatiales bacterium (ex Bugula neritina AB1)]